MQNSKAVAVALLVAALNCLYISDSKSAEKLEGSYFMGSPDLDGGISDLPKDYFYIRFTGKAAKDLYNSLPGKEIRQEGADEVVYMYKRSGNMNNISCLRFIENAVGYNCSFGVNINSLTVHPAPH